MPSTQIYDDTKKLKRTLDLIEPVIAASWLNIKGDIVAALDRNLVVIRADTYQFLSQDEMVSLLAEHTKGMIPGAPQPAPSRSSALQRQATLKQQLSMIPAALCDDFLTHLMTLSADARLSIFDVPPSRPEVSETAVVARVATAAKAWQRYRSAARGPLPNEPATATSDSSNPAAIHSKADSAAQLSSAEAKGHPCGSDRHASHAAASSSAATHVSSHAGKQKVGFGQGLAVDRQSASVQGSSRSSAAQHSGNRSAAHHIGQHDPGNVNMHMGIMNRCALETCCIHSTLTCM